MTASTTPPAHTSMFARLTPRSAYRVLAIAESVTWTLLIIGMLLKYMAGLGRLPVLIGGSIHGFVFIAYGLTAVLIGVNQRWGIARTVSAVATAIVPYATIPFDRHLERKGLLEGDWHRERTDDSRDDAWPRVFLRSLLNHPVMLITLFILGTVVIMSALLFLGPPGSWGTQ